MPTPRKRLLPVVALLVVLALPQVALAQLPKGFNLKDLSKGPDLSGYTIYVILQSHMDLAWRWRWWETQDFVLDTFRQNVGHCEKKPFFHYSQSQAVLYKFIEENDPELFERLKKVVADGKWNIVGGSWVENDLNLTGPEAHVRQLLHGQHYFRDKFGKEAAVAWAPDSFGHPWTLPQVYARSHLKYHAFRRGGKNVLVFNWQGPDGTRVPSYDVGVLFDLLGAFEGVKDIAQGKEKLKEQLDALGFKVIAIGFGEGDHGGGPNQNEMMGLTMFHSGLIKGLPTMKVTTADEAMEQVVKSMGELPVIMDELNFVFEGCYTSQVEVKRRNRMDEEWLASAEKLACMARHLAGAKYPKEQLNTAWEKVMFNQFHDILPGTSITRVFDDAHRTYSEAEDTLEAVTNDSFAALAPKLNIRPSSLGVVVFNPLSWKRTGIVDLVVDFKSKPDGIILKDGYGRDATRIEGQIIEEQKLYHAFSRCRCLFLLKDIPPMGCRTYYVFGTNKSALLRPMDHFDRPYAEQFYKAYRPMHTYWSQTRPAGGKGSALKAGKNRLENARFVVEINPKTGRLSRIFDKTLKAELLAEGAEGNALELIEDDAGGHSSWEIRLGAAQQIDKPAGIRVVENGPVRATIQVDYRLGGAIIEQRISLYDGLDRIEFTNQTQWRERAKTLKVRFPLAVEQGTFTRDLPFGWILSAANGAEVPAQKWVDLTGTNFGVSLLNDSRYGHDANGSTLGLTLLRSPVAPDPMGDVGIHAATYALWPHSAQWKVPETVRRGFELNAPMIACLPDIETMKTAPGAAPAALPEPKPLLNASLLSIDAPNVVLTALKEAHKDDSLILRIYECGGETETPVNVAFGTELTAAEEVDLLEDKVADVEFKGKTLSFKAGPFQIRTFRVKLAPPPEPEPAPKKAEPAAAEQ